jgi:hypothetical protein
MSKINKKIFINASSLKWRKEAIGVTPGVRLPPGAQIKEHTSVKAMAGS